MRHSTVPSGRRGSTLIVSLGLLALISLLAFSFLGLSRSERMISRNYVDRVRASMLAQSGLEYALAHLRAATLEKAWDDPLDPWIYHDDTGTGIGAAVPLAAAAAPSLWKGSSFGHAHSLLLPGTYAEGGDAATLKIIDGAAQINLNGLQPNLRTLLDTLGLAIQEELRLRGFSPAIDPVRGRGAQIVLLRNRLGGRFVTEESLLPLIGEEDFDILRDYVTVWGWEDPTVIIRAGPPDTNGLPRVRLLRRAPVNINTAPRAVLQTVLAGLNAAGSQPISFADAGKVAEEILAKRISDADGEGAFTSWPEVYAFLDTLGGGQKGILTDAQVSCCKANANPNAVLHAFNPDAAARLPIDKSDLTYATTEFTFRSMGHYEIESLGRVFRPDGEIVAESVIRATPVIYDVLYATTQDDFEDGRSSVATDNTASFPVSQLDVTPAKTAWYSGYLQLQTHERMPAPGAAGRLLTALWRDSLNGMAGSPDPAVLGNRNEGIGLFPGSDLFPDGTYGNALRRETLGYSTSGNLTDAEGTIEFWVKFDDSPSVVLQPVFTATHPITSQTGLQHLLKGAIVGGSLILESSRVFYIAADFAPPGSRLAYPAPYANEQTVISAVIPDKGRPNEWHHIVLAWFDGTDQRLYVDGQVYPVTAYVPTSPAWADAGELPYTAICTFGGRVNGAGQAEFPAMTIDDVMAYDNETAYPAVNFFPRDRFEGLDPVYNGVWTGAFPTIPYPVTLGPMAWTEWIPETYDGKPLLNRPAGLNFGAVGGPARPGLGAGTVNLDKKSPEELKAVELKVDSSNSGSGGGGNTGGTTLSPYTGDCSDATIKAAPSPGPWTTDRWYDLNPDLKAVFDASRIRAAKKLPPNKNGGSAKNFGAPQVLVTGDSLHYTFQFVNPTMLSPMNVTPAIDDVTLLYQGPLRFLAYHLDPGGP